MCFLLSQVVLAADMLGLEGLKDVAEMVLTRDYCKFFPKVRKAVVVHGIFSLHEKVGILLCKGLSFVTTMGVFQNLTKPFQHSPYLIFSHFICLGH